MSAQPGPIVASLLVRLKGDKLYVVDNPNTSPMGRPRMSRGRIEAFTFESARRLRDYLLSCDAEYRVFGTLTYPLGVPAGQQPHLAKDNLRALLERVRREWGAESARESSICWWMELTQAGTIHFHFLGTRFIDKRWLARAWYEVVGSDDERHLRAGTQIDALRSREASVGYAAKYATKQVNGDLPPGMAHPGRWWGVFGKRSCVEADIRVLRPATGPENADLAEVNRRIRGIMQDLVNEGVAKVVPIDERDYPGVTMIKIPSINQRRVVRQQMMDLKYLASVHFDDLRNELDWMEHQPTGSIRAEIY